MVGRRASLAAVVLVACTTELTSGTRHDGSSADGATTPSDAHVPSDAAIGDAAIGDGSSPDAPAVTDAALVPDTGPACVPTRTTCNMALECGAIPNGCPGGVVACVPCTSGETYCATLAAPRWRSRVMSCVTSVSSAHPEYFDATMACSTGFTFVLPSHALDLARDVAACVDGSGAHAIVDPNAPMNEIRVRGTDDDIADNYSVRLYGSGCSSARYTSSCTPSFF